MAEEIAFENGRIPNFEGLVTLTFTLDRVILHTVVHHASTSTYMPNFTKIEKTFCGRTTYVRTDRRTFETGFIKSTLLKSRPKTGHTIGLKHRHDPTHNCWLVILDLLPTLLRTTQRPWSEKTHLKIEADNVLRCVRVDCCQHACVLLF